MSDYKNVYKIDYMEEIFRFDTGEFLEGFEAQEEKKSPYEIYMEILIFPKHTLLIVLRNQLMRHTFAVK